MQQDYQKILERSRSRKTQYQKLAVQLRGKKNQHAVDLLVNEAHEEAFEKIDCLSCANCCKTTGPLWTRKDIERVAASKQMKPAAFMEKYLRVDEDQDYVLKQLPCTFLGQDHYCSIYEQRPEACRDYPHTHRRQMKNIMKETVQNAVICPAVGLIFERIQEKIQTLK